MNYLAYYTDDCINVQEQELDSQMLFHLFSTLYIAPFKIPQADDSADNLKLVIQSARPARRPGLACPRSYI